MSCKNPGTCKCDCCNARVNRKDGLTHHQSGACKSANYKKFSVCCKEFSKLSNLKRHILVHKNEKDQAKKFSRGICGKSYKRKIFTKITIQNVTVY